MVSFIKKIKLIIISILFPLLFLIISFSCLDQTKQKNIILNNQNLNINFYSMLTEEMETNKFKNDKIISSDKYKEGDNYDFFTKEQSNEEDTTMNPLKKQIIIILILLVIIIILLLIKWKVKKRRILKKIKRSEYIN